MQNIGGEVKIRKVAVHLPRFAGLGPKRGKLRKVAIHLPRLAGKATGGSPAMVSRFEPRKKVWLNLLASAGEWSLIKPAACGWCSPVLGLVKKKGNKKELAGKKPTQFNTTKFVQLQSDLRERLIY